MTSLASVKGPSVTVILPLDSRARAPRAVGPRPPIPTITPCLLPSSPSFTILSMSAGDGCAPVSRVFTIVMNRMLFPRALFVLCDRRALPLFLLAQLGRERGAEVLSLEDLPDFDLALLERNALRPLQRLGLVLHLPDPEAGDQLFGLRERAVTHGALGTRIRDARPLGRRLQSLTRQHHAGLYQLVVELAHFGQHLLRRQDARLRVFIGFHHHEKSHLALAFFEVQVRSAYT